MFRRDGGDSEFSIHPAFGTQQVTDVCTTNLELELKGKLEAKCVSSIPHEVDVQANWVTKAFNQ